MKAIESRKVIPAFCSEGLGLYFSGRNGHKTSKGMVKAQPPIARFREATEVEPSYAMAIVCSYVLQRFPRLQHLPERHQSIWLVTPRTWPPFVIL